METVLIVGASGRIGVSAITAAQRAGKQILAIVRNQESINKLSQHVEDDGGIIVEQADLTDENGLQDIVDRVRKGELPEFQHVYSTVGALNPTSPLQDLDTAAFRENMKVNVEANFFAYRATVPYLLERGHPNATWTLITGGAGELGLTGVTAISQGALFSMANAACRENAVTNVRFNEVYLCYRVDFDSAVGSQADKIKVSDFARVYEQILVRKGLKGCRISIHGPGDLDNLKVREKLSNPAL